MKNYKLEGEVKKRANCEKSVKKAKVNNGLWSHLVIIINNNNILLKVYINSGSTNITMKPG
jgi:hypothetical protein